MKASLVFEVEYDDRTDADSVAVAFDILLDTAMSSPSVLDGEFNPAVISDVSVLRDPSLLSGDKVRSALKPQLGELWDACLQCIEDPDDENFDKFRQLCRPAEIMLLLRQWAENNREDRDVCSRSL